MIRPCSLNLLSLRTWSYDQSTDLWLLYKTTTYWAEIITNGEVMGLDKITIKFMDELIMWLDFTDLEGLHSCVCGYVVG